MDAIWAQPAQRFNANLDASLDAKVRRAIRIHEGQDVDASAFKVLIGQAIALSSSGLLKPSRKRSPEAFRVEGNSARTVGP